MSELSLSGLVYLVLSAGAAYFTKGITGFGNTLVMASLFSFILSNRLTTPVDLIFSIPANAYLVWLNRKSLSLRLVAPLALTMVLGAIPGTLLLKTGDDRVLKALLGFVIIGIALDMVFRKSQAQPAKSRPVWFIATGIVSGILAGLYGISAILISSVSRNTKNREAFRANICLVFLVDNLFRTAVYLLTGLFTQQALKLSLYIAPAVVIGLWAGVKVDRKLKDSTVRLAIIVLLLLSGCALVIKNIL